MKHYPFGHIHKSSLISDAILSAGLENNLDELNGIFLSGQNRAKEIAESNERTKVGKVKDLQALGEELKTELNKWRSQFHYDEMIKQLEAAMTPTRSNPENYAAESRMREIRDYLRSVDPIEQETMYREAAEKGNDLFLEAIERSPVPFKFSTQKLIDKIQIMRLQKQYPEQASKLNDLRIAQGQLDSALGSVRQELAKSAVDVVSEGNSSV